MTSRPAREIDGAAAPHRAAGERVSSQPAWVDRMDRVGALPTIGAPERAVVLAALRWADAEGVLWPSMASWAQMAGIPVRSVQRILRRLCERGVVEVVEASSGGPHRTGQYRIPALALDPDRAPESEPRQARHQTPTQQALNPGGRAPEPRQAQQQTPTHGTPNPDGRAPEPRPTVGGTIQEQPVETTAAAVAGVLAALDQGLLTHPNATPERLAWIERAAPSKRCPEGWAASCIREGWPVPPATPQEQAAQRRALRESLWARFRAMSAAEQDRLVAEAHRWFPNLEGRGPDEPAMKGAITRIMASTMR